MQGQDKVYKDVIEPLESVSINMTSVTSARLTPRVDLKTVVYHADDVLDDFRYEVMHRRATQIRRRCSTARKVHPTFSSHSGWLCSRAL